MKRCALVMVLAGCWLTATGAEPRSGRVDYSDGKSVTGRLSLTPGSELKLHVGNQLKVLALERVREIQMAPEKEELEQKYRFVDAGKAFRETEGQPYPVRYLKTTVLLAGGESITGHLYTTVLYVEGDETAQKVILAAKQRGKEGESLKSLVYPAKVVFADAPASTETMVRLQLKLHGLNATSEVVALTRGPLLRLEALRAAGAGEYRMPSALGNEFFLAVKTGARIVVGWPGPPDEKVLALVRNALPHSEDFFDERKLLGAFRDAENSEIYSLMLASRKGQTTLEETRSQPWRLELYRWKQETEGPRVMLAGQGYWFRGIGAKNEAVPAVELSHKLWRVRKVGDAWVAADE